MKVYLRDWRTHLDISQTEIAKRIGVSKGEISRLETGSRRITIEWLNKLGVAFGVDPKMLLSRPTGEPDAFMIAERGKPSFISSPAPRFSHAAQKPALETPFSLSTNKPNLKLYWVQSDSMLPTLQQGDAVQIDTSITAPMPPGLFMLDEMGGRVIRRVHGAPATGKVRVSCDNERYDSYEADASALKIVGRVVARISNT